jgi:hypothetical protein
MSDWKWRQLKHWIRTNVSDRAALLDVMQRLDAKELNLLATSPQQQKESFFTVQDEKLIGPFDTVEEARDWCEAGEVAKPFIPVHFHLKNGRDVHVHLDEEQDCVVAHTYGPRAGALLIIPASTNAVRMTAGGPGVAERQNKRDGGGL